MSRRRYTTVIIIDSDEEDCFKPRKRIKKEKAKNVSSTPKEMIFDLCQFDSYIPWKNHDQLEMPKIYMTSKPLPGSIKREKSEQISNVHASETPVTIAPALEQPTFRDKADNQLSNGLQNRMETTKTARSEQKEMI